MLIAAEQSKVLKEQVAILDARILNYQSLITNLNQKDSATVASYELQIKTMKEQRALHEDQIKTMEKMIRTEKRKRTLTTIAGTLTTVIGLYLYISK